MEELHLMSSSTDIERVLIGVIILSSSKQDEARAKGALANILEQHDWAVELENLDDWLGIIKEFVTKVPCCLACGNVLKFGKFVDARDSEDKPCDINEDLYCPNCGLRWAQTPPPHEFFREG